MSFYNGNVTGDIELKMAIDLMREYGQITVKQLELMTELNETEARQIMHQAFHKRLVTEVTKDKYVLKSVEPSTYSNDMEYAITLVSTLCNENEQFNLNECFKETEDPYLIFIGTDAQDFDVVYVPEGKERITTSKLTRKDKDSNLLLIIEHIGQMETLSKLENVSAVYLVKDGVLEYVEQ